MIRAGLYLLAAGAIWIAEGIVFSRFLGFTAWQTTVIVLMYAGFFGMACLGLIKQTRSHRGHTGSQPLWRYVALAPMLTVVLGSFASLPLLVAVSVLGKLV